MAVTEFHLLAVIYFAMVMTLPSTGCPVSCVCNWNGVTCTSPSASSMADIVREIPSHTNQLMIKGSMFRDLSANDFGSASWQLSHLSITNSQLQSINSNTFQMVGSSLQTLNLNDNQITSLYADSFSHLTGLMTLNLARNKLQTFPANIFLSLVNLKYMDLQHNTFTDLPNGVFSAQRSLQNLHLEGNGIRSLKSDSLKGLHSLRNFLASGCKISSIESGSLSKITNVDTLDLSYNSLIQLPSNSDIQNLRVLRNFSLVGNRLTGLNEGQFHGLSLDSLDLSQNNINFISPNAFSFLSVRNLDLSSNMLTTLPEPVFQDLATQLHSLKLGANRGIQLLPPNIFRDMYMLQDLNLAGCSLQEFQEEHFLSVQNLQQLDISHNQLRFLPESLINRAKFMRHVRLENNAWHCDCKIAPLRNWLQEPRSTSIIYCYDQTPTAFNNQCRPPTCSTPPNLAQSQLVGLTDEDIDTCQSDQGVSSVPIGIIVGLCAVVLVVVAVALAVGCFLWRRHKRGEPLLKMCGDDDKRSQEPKDEFYVEKKQRSIDPDIGSLNESDKSFVVRNYFHSMVPDPEGVSRGTPSLTRQGSYDSQSAFGCDSKYSHNGSHYSLNDGFKRESAV